MPTPAHQCKALRTIESFANSWICFNKIWRPCLNFDFYLVPIACSQSEINTGKNYLLCIRLKTRISKFTSVQSRQLCGNGCLFLWGAYFCMGAYKRPGCNQNWCLYSWGAYFLRFLIIPILWYEAKIEKPSLSFFAVHRSC